MVNYYDRCHAIETIHDRKRNQDRGLMGQKVLGEILQTKAQRHRGFLCTCQRWLGYIDIRTLVRQQETGGEGNKS